MPGSQCTRSLVWVEKPHELVTTSTPENPAFPHAMVYGLFRALPGDRLSDSHILEPQSGAVFDAAEGFEAYSHDLWARVSVIGSPSSKPSNDPGSEAEPPFWMWVFLLRGSALEFGRERFKHRLVIRLESLDQFFLGLSITGADQLHDRDRRHSSCGDELDHDPGFANVGLLDIKTRGLERAEELLDGPAPAVEVYDPTCLFWASHNVSSEKPPMDRLALLPPWEIPDGQGGLFWAGWG